MLQGKWGSSNEGKNRNLAPTSDHVNNTGQNQSTTAKVKADASGDNKQVIFAGRNSLVLPINIPIKAAIALPAVAAGLQLPILSGSGDAIEDSKVDSDLPKL